MGTRKKKDRRKAKRTAVLSASMNGISFRQVSGTDELREVFDSLAQRYEASTRAQLEAVNGDAGPLLLVKNDNRRPFHLLPAAEMFDHLPDHEDVRHLAAPIRRRWADYLSESPCPNALDFITSEMPPWSDLGQRWNRLAAYEQDYMEVWSTLNARDSVAALGAPVPSTTGQLRLALEQALESCRAARDAQNAVDPRSVYAYDSILFLPESRIRELLESLNDECDWFSFTWDEVLEQGHLHFREESGASDHTGSAAGYAAAVETLRSHGVACEQWSYWD